MGDKTRGLYDKFIIERADGTHEHGRKHFGCQYFVLDIDHDPHVVPALKAYAKSCRGEYPLLADDVDDIVGLFGDGDGGGDGG